MEPLEECRTLLRNQNEPTLKQRFKRICRLPSEKFIEWGIIMCILLGIMLLIAMQLFIPHTEIEVEYPSFIEEEDEFINSTTDLSTFLSEWKKMKTELREERLKLLKLYKEVSANTSRISPDDRDFLFAANHSVPLKMVDCALILEKVKRSLKKCLKVDILPEECMKLIRDNTQCDSSYPYSYINGSCNNLINPLWGSSGAPYLRLLKAQYADDVSALRLSVYGTDLPNPRLLSSRIYEKRLRPEAETTMMFMNFGLFVDHDFIKSLLPFKEIVLRCCDPKVIADPRLRNPACAEISVPLADPFFIEKNVTCMEFYRSIPSIGSCPGRREQANVMSAYIDLSDTYGPTNEEHKALRAFENGKMQYSLIDSSPLLPLKSNGTFCYTRDANYKCFRSGDVRVNMQVEIMVLHTIWLREHNRLAEELQKINPHWDDERLFQEARRINIAEFQHIVFNEFVPNILGKERMKKYGLEINPDEEYDGYDETVQAGVYNAFSSAAFRFGHSLVQSIWEFRGPDYKVRSRLPVHEFYMNPSVIYKHGMDDIIRGMASQRTYTPDRHTTQEVHEWYDLGNWLLIRTTCSLNRTTLEKTSIYEKLRNRLLQRYNQDHGLDLTMITILRGRDRGVPHYTKWRKFCGLEEILSWDDMYKVMDKIRAEELREMYMSVDDVDLVTGGLAEYPIEGGLVGPTYACIIWRQFKNARVSDRFWFENKNQAGSFTPMQLKEIYKSNFARILCDNADNLEKIQRFPFRISSNENPMMSCSSIPVVNLEHWIEKVDN